MRLTVKDRILLHLLPYGQFREAVEVPRAMAQDGIAEASWTARRHLSQYLRPLMQQELIRERKTHVQGIRQRRKVYLLTGAGKRAAARLRDRVMLATVQVEDGDGVLQMTVKEILAQPEVSATPLGILRIANQGAPIPFGDLKRLAEPPRIEVLAEAPRIEDFVGRKRELETLTQDDGVPRLFVIRGVAGIGKSSLASRACELLRGRSHLFWHRVRPWDSRDSILARLAAFLASLGKPGLRAVLMRGQAERAAEVLREDLPGTHATLVFDDAHRADTAVQPFFPLLLDVLVRAEDVRVFVLTRTALPFYSRKDVVLSGLVEELELQGLDAEEVDAYLAQHELPEEAGRVARKLHGHPLFLELLRAHNPLEGALVDVRRYLEEEVYAGLRQAERGMMKMASLYQVPVPRDALFADPEWSHEVLLSLADGSLVRRVGEVEERFEAHDTIRDFFADITTPAERRSLAGFAVERLQILASKAREGGEFGSSSGYLSNAVELATDPTEQASLWEALGDVNLELGDLFAVSHAYRAAARLAADAETKARAHRKMAHALQDWGDVTAADGEIEAGFEALAGHLSVERGWLHLARSRGLVEGTAMGEAREDVETALSAFRDFKESAGEAKALLQLVNVLGYTGVRRKGHPVAQDCLREVLKLAASLDDPELAARAHTWMTRVVAAEGGSVETVTAHLDAAGTILERTAKGNYRVRLEFLGQRAALHGSIDADFEARAADCREIIRIAAPVRSDSDTAYGTYLLASVDLVNGKTDGARRGYEEAAEAWHRYGNLRMYGSTLFHIGLICLMQADREGFDRARTTLDGAAAKYRGEYPTYPAELDALNELIEGDSQAWREPFEQMLAEMKRRHEEGWGAFFNLPWTHSIYGAALRAAGNEHAASDQLRLAREYYEAGRLPGHLAKMDAEVNRLTKGLRRMIASA